MKNGLTMIFCEEIFTLSDFVCNNFIDLALRSDWALKIILSKWSFSNVCINFLLEYPNISDRTIQHLLLFQQLAILSKNMKYKFKETKLIKYRICHLAYHHWTITIHSTGMKQSNSGVTWNVLGKNIELEISEYLLIT